ncbi:MAG: D-alanyl-D-alanine carboxypeptidase [Lachnospiraceae bacterium]
MKKKKITAVILIFLIMLNCIPVYATEDTSSEQTSSGQEQPVKPPVAKKSLVKTGFIPANLSAPPEIVAEAGIVIDMTTGYTLYEKNIQQQHYPASITKIMTAILSLENLKMEDAITFSHDAVYTIEPGSSSAYAEEGEQLTVEQCLYGLMLISGNDVANALGEAVSGSMDAFAQKMTEKAVELGCIGTQFKNAHGLHDEGHYTTAYDMAVIASYAYTNFEAFRTLCSTIRYDVPPTNLYNETRYWLNSNRMLREGEEYYYEACNGGKTGFTNEAGGTFVSYANLDGRQVLSVIMKSTNSASAYSDTIHLYDYIRQNVKPEDYAALDAKAAEDESIAASIANSALETTGSKNTSEESNDSKEENEKNDEKESKVFNVFVKIALALVVLFLLAYFYVNYKRIQAKKRRIARRRQWEREENERSIQRRQLDKELAERRRKYRNIDFSDKK